MTVIEPAHRGLTDGSGLCTDPRCWCNDPAQNPLHLAEKRGEKACSRERALAIGRQLARQLFAKRGNNSEVHLSEVELAALCALAAERALALPAIEMNARSDREV